MISFTGEADKPNPLAWTRQFATPVNPFNNTPPPTAAAASRRW